MLSASLIIVAAAVILFAYRSNRTSSTLYESGADTERTPTFSANTSEQPTPSPFESSQPTPTPTATPPPSSAVRLRLLYSGASAYSAAEGVEVTLQSSTQNFSQTTESLGFITFHGVPCGEEVEINYRSDAVDRKLLRIKRYVDCGASLNDMGIFSATYGERLGSTESDLDGPVLN
jgi:hypothetical protein